VSRETENPVDDSSRRFALDSQPTAAEATAVGAESVGQVPRFRGALDDGSGRPGAGHANTPDPGEAAPRRRDALDRRRSEGGAERSSAVFRSRDFEKWRKRRSQPALKVHRPSDAAEGEDTETLRLERPDGPPLTGEALLQAARIEDSRNRPQRSAELLEQALPLNMAADTRWAVARRLAELYIDRGSDSAALPLLRELCQGRHGDPYPLVVLAELIAEEEPLEAATLRERAAEIAPWLSGTIGES
jgi:hypothetical protein